MALWTVGIDPASRRDRFAIVVHYRSPDGCWLTNARAVTDVALDYITEASLETLARLDQAVPRNDRLLAVIDRNGLGLGPAQQLRQGLRSTQHSGLSRHVHYRALTATDGDAVSKDAQHSWMVNVGRNLLTQGTLMALRSGELDIKQATGDGAPLLADEIAGLVTKVAPSGKVRVDHKPGQHDDLFMALGMAHWLATSTGLGGYSTVKRRAPASAAPPAAAAPTAKPKKRGATLASVDSVGARRNGTAGMSRTLTSAPKWARR